MNADSRPRKQIPKSPKAAKASGRRRSAASKGVARGELKGKPVATDELALPAKAGVAAARRAAAESERAPSSRRELPLPMESSSADREAPNRSLLLRLLVEGDRVRVLDAVDVDVPAPAGQPVRGTNFVEVRAGDEILTIQPIVDPGLEIGIPDPADTTEFRGHREVAVPSWEVAIRVPLGALEAAASRGGDRSTEPSLEVSLYRAPETIEIDPSRFAVAREARGQLARFATSGQVRIDQLGAESRGRKPEPK